MRSRDRSMRLRLVLGVGAALLLPLAPVSCASSVGGAHDAGPTVVASAVNDTTTSVVDGSVEPLITIAPEVASPAQAPSNPPTEASTEQSTVSTTASTAIRPISMTVRSNGSTIEVGYAGGDGSFARGAAAALYGDSGGLVAVLVQSVDGSPMYWSPPTESLTVPAVQFVGPGPDRFTVEGLAAGPHRLCVDVGGSEICSFLDID